MPTRGRSQFEGPTARDRVQDILFGCVDVSGAALMAYCIMQDHVHLIAGHSDGGPGISRFIGGFKSIVSRSMFPAHRGIWVPRFDDVILTSDKVFNTKLNYIHENPVRAGLCAKAGDWKWSSARFWLADEPSDVLKKTWDWGDPWGDARRGRLASTSSPADPPQCERG